MAGANHALDLYQQLADLYEKQGQAQMRDRFLVLAADAALAGQNPEAAERYRARLLQQNPHHLLKPYTSFAEAMKAADVQNYVADLRRTYSPETAEHLLASLRAPSAPAAPPGSPPDEELPGLEPLPEEQPEVLQFYRVHEDLEEIPEPVKQRQAPAARPVPRPTPPPPAPSAPARPPAVAPPPMAKMPARKPPRSPAVSPYSMEPLRPAPPRPARRAREEEDLASGAWVAYGLFGLVLVAGLALAVYTLVRPFLPAEWLP